MLDLYKTRMGYKGSGDGRARVDNAEKIMEASWMRDVATKPVYVKWVDFGLPEVKSNDVPLYAKFNAKSYHTVTGDEIAYLLQFRISDMKSHPEIKVGSYIQMKNELGIDEWWLIVHLDDRPQFRQFSILKCSCVYTWVSWSGGKRVIHKCLGVARSQNSYNAGVWFRDMVQSLKNQATVIMPINEDSNTLKYDMRFLLSNEGRYPPIAWKISKIQIKASANSEFEERNHIVTFTMEQDQFNPDADNPDLMIADYYKTSISPVLADHQPLDMKIGCFGNATVRVGGSFKKFTLQSLGENNDFVDITEGVVWNIYSDEIPMEKLSFIGENGAFKVKCARDYYLSEKTFTLSATYEGKTTTLIVEVIAT